MNLKIEKHPELSRLTHCFQKIEILAKDLGCEVDELIKKDSIAYSSDEFQSGQLQSILAEYRAHIFRDSGWEIIR